MMTKCLTNAATAVVILGLIALLVGPTNAIYHYSRPKPVRWNRYEQARLRQLRKFLTRKVNKIARIVAEDLNPGRAEFNRPTKFTVEVDTVAETVHIEMEDILVIGDGEGCAEDPPGVSCVCPC